MTTVGLSVFGADVATSARIARAAELAGLDAAWANGLYSRSATVPLAAMAAATERCRLGSSIMYGIGRTPLVLAAEARDLDEVSGGRLVLGLGNGTRRMMSDWHGIADLDSPALRMEELVPLLRRLWRLHEGPVKHEGRFYRLDLVPTGEVPPPLRERIPIHTAGVRPRMIEAAGRVSDGLIAHPLSTVKYLEEVARPAIERGTARTGRDPSDVEMVSIVICSIHDDPDLARREVAGQIAFYSSVKTYDVLLDVNGFASEGRAIREAFARRDLPGMVAAVSEEMVEAIAVSGTAGDVREGLRRFEGVLDHVILCSPTHGLARERAEENLMSLIPVAGSPQPV